MDSFTPKTNLLAPILDSVWNIHAIEPPLIAPEIVMVPISDGPLPDTKQLGFHSMSKSLSQTRHMGLYHTWSVWAFQGV